MADDQLIEDFLGGDPPYDDDIVETAINSLDDIPPFDEIIENLLNDIDNQLFGPDPPPDTIFDDFSFFPNDDIYRVTQPPTAPPGDNELFIYFVPLILILAIAFAILGIWNRNKWERHIRRTRELRGQEEERNAVELSQQPQDVQANNDNHVECSVEELITQYNEAFERKKNQIVLKESQILRGSEIDEEDNDDQDEELQRDTTKDDSSIRLALTSARALHSELRAANSNRGTLTESKRGLVHPRNTAKTRASCVVCLEPMQAGDLVVWSETKSCPHVFHKECLVSFLAHNRKQQLLSPRSSLQQDNPCPVCRQPFVAL